MKPGSLFLVKRNVMIANENNRNTNNSNGNDEILNDASGVDQKENGTINENTDFRSDLLEEEENLMDISEETDISSSLTASTTSAFVSFEFHIVYSKSYNVPVMYLNASYLGNVRI